MFHARKEPPAAIALRRVCCLYWLHEAALALTTVEARQTAHQLIDRVCASAAGENRPRDSTVHRSSGFSPVFFPIFPRIAGPSSSESWNENG
jgi:hypothetical protein